MKTFEIGTLLHRKTEKDPVYIKKNKQKSLFINFIDSIKNIFFPSPPQVPAQESSSREIQRHTDKTLDKLLNIKEKLKSKIDEELFKQVEIAIDPIARDAKRIQKMIASANGKEDLKTNKKYHQWTAKAERWVKLDSKLNLQISIIEAIIEQTFTETKEQIDQDLQIIEDYKAHLVANLAVTTEEKESLEKLIAHHLSIHTKELINLKEKPNTLEISKITTWKNEIDQQRTLCFENALHKIDAIIEQISPLVDHHEEESNKELNILEVEAKIIEKETIALMFESLQEGSVDDHKKTTLLSRIQWLQHKTHQQNLDLLLPTEQSDQLGKITSAIERINKNIVNFD